MDVFLVTTSVMVVSAGALWRLLAPLGRPLVPARLPLTAQSARSQAVAARAPTRPGPCG